MHWSFDRVAHPAKVSALLNPSSIKRSFRFTVDSP